MIHYGGDYNPEQWPEDVWTDDVRLMREAGVTTVSLGIFAWSRIQPAEGVFDFDWLDRVIDLLHEGGITVDLATATASPPPWLTHRYPEVLPADQSGAPLGIGSRQQYAPSSPVYRRLAGELVRAIAERYVRHPAVVMWHINNEYGCHLNVDYSDAAQNAFQRWLEAKYTTTDALNEAWGAAFWSQLYGSFDEVRAPRNAPYSHNPSQLLDYRRFTSDMLLECYLMEKAILLGAGATQPITTNFMGGFKPADYWKWAPHLDVISDDSYPDPNEDDSFRASAFTRDLMRSLGGQKPWILMEQSTGALSWRPSNAPKAPGQMTATSMQAVARGADGILFFQWRQARAGAEKFHSAMLPQAGTDTRIFREVTALGATLAQHDAAPLSPDDASVAVVLDWESWWAVENPDHPREVDYLASVQAWHAALHRRHLGVDVVPPSADLSRYGLVLAPHLYLLSAPDAANLTSYVDAGGRLLVTCFSDVVDENDHFRLGGYTTQLGPTLGIRVEDFGALVDEGRGQRTAGVALPDGEIRGSRFAEEIHATAAEVVARFSDGRTAGAPALTRNRVGAGQAWYIATVPDDAGLDAVVDLVLAGSSVRAIAEGLPVAVEASRRSSDVYLINHSSAAVAIPAVLGEAARELAPWEWVRLRT